MMQTQVSGELMQAVPQHSRPSLKELMESYERSLIEAALQATAGNQRRAAVALGLLPTTLHEKMKRLGLLRRHVAPMLVPQG